LKIGIECLFPETVGMCPCLIQGDGMVQHTNLHLYTVDGWMISFTLTPR
jgi:hypothetical protein